MPHDEPVERVGPGGTAAGFRLLVVPGVNPGRWLDVWAQRLPDVPLVLVQATAAAAAAALREGRADAGLVRLPVDRDRFSAIPLYTETTVVVVPTDHLVAAADEVVAVDLDDEVLLVPGDDVLPWPDRPGEPSAMAAPATTAQAMEQVAAGVGVLVVPQSLARLHHRRDLTYRPVTDAPTSAVGLVWVTDAASDLVEELIGIVRGRTVNSSRGRGSGTGAAGTSSGEPARGPVPRPASTPRPAPTAGARRGGGRAGSGGRRSPGRRGGPGRSGGRSG